MGSEESQGTHKGGSGAVGPELRNEGSKALPRHCLGLGETAGELQSERYLSLAATDGKCLQLPTARLLSPLFCPHTALRHGTPTTALGC